MDDFPSSSQFSVDKETSFQGGTLPGVPIQYDCFKQEFGQRTAFHILSHLHSDHCEGLKDKWTGAPIYCSIVTRRLLLQKWDIDPSLVIGLQYHVVHSVPFLRHGADPDQEYCTIELFDANHCPGSAMFLIRGYFGTYFLSGDFRFSPSMKKRLLQRGIDKEAIDCLFADCTFSDPFWKFPSQKEAIQQILSLIRENPTSQVYIESEMLGLEPILITISKTFRSKIHVDRVKWKASQALPALLQIFTLNEDESRFHVCPHKTFSAYNRKMEGSSVRYVDICRSSATRPSCESSHLFIKPSTMWFGANRHSLPNLLPYHRAPAKAKDAWHVLYSIHSSYDELLEFVKLLHPRRLIPWTECSSDMFYVMQELLDPSPPRDIVIPSSMGSQFPYLLRQFSDSNQKQKLQVIEMNQKEDSSLSCWSPSPPISPRSSQEDACVILDDFEIQLCKIRNREWEEWEDMDEEDQQPPCSKRARIGW